MAYTCPTLPEWTKEDGSTYLSCIQLAEGVSDAALAKLKKRLDDEDTANGTPLGRGKKTVDAFKEARDKLLNVKQTISGYVQTRDTLLAPNLIRLRNDIQAAPDEPAVAALIAAFNAVPPNGEPVVKKIPPWDGKALAYLLTLQAALEQQFSEDAYAADLLKSHTALWQSRNAFIKALDLTLTLELTAAINDLSDLVETMKTVRKWLDRIGTLLDFLLKIGLLAV